MRLGATAALVFTLVVAPLPYGGVLPGGALTIELCAAVSLLLAALTTPFPNVRPLRLPLIAASLLIAFGALQLLPLGDAVVSSLSPVTASIYRDASQTVAAYAHQSTLRTRISLAPHETLSTLMLISAYLALFVASFGALRNRALRRIFALGVIVSAAVQIVIGVAGDEVAERMHGSYVNPNHLGSQLEIALAVAFALLWAEVLTRRDRIVGVSDRATQIERQVLPLVPYALLWGFVAAGIALTRSRGALIAALVSTAVLVILGAASIRRGRRSGERLVIPIVVAALFLGVAFVVSATGASALTRFESIENRGDTRLRTWQLSVEAWRHFPIVGSGLGAFREAFRRVQTSDFKGLLEYAHNDFLQLLVSGGVVGALLGVAAVLSVLVMLMRLWREQKHREERALTLGAIGALLSLVIHGVVDFGLSIPSVAAMLAMVCGWGLAAGTAHGKEAE